jgi:hypothetical protein
MSLSSYSDLKTAVGDWLARSGSSALQARVGDWIALCEAELQRLLRTREMEFRYTASLSSQYLALPDDFGGFKRVKLTSTSPEVILSPLDQQGLNYLWRATDTGKPKNYAIIGSEMQFGPTPDGTYTVEAIYHKKFAALTTTSTNWILDDHPDVYLYGVLKHAIPFMNEDDASSRGPVFTALYQAGVDQMREQDIRDRWAGPLTMRNDLTHA